MLNIQTRVFSRVKNKTSAILLPTYPNLNFTTSDRVADNPQFPTVYIHEMSSMEDAEDLDGTTINAIMSTFQIEVTDNEDMANCHEVMSEIVNVMKSMRFKVTQIPEFNNTNDIYRIVARFNRTIASGDVL